MLQETDGLGIDELVDHVVEDGRDGIEAFVGLADVVKTGLIEEDLLHDENGDCFREFAACLHDAKTKRYNFRREQKRDDFGVVILDERANHTQAGEPQVLERAGFARRVEERIQIERYMG